MKCADVSAVLIDYCKDELDAGERARVAAHLAGCPACRDEQRLLRAAYGEIAALPAFPLSRDISDIADAARRQPPAIPWFRPALAPLAIGLALLAGGLYWSHRSLPPQQIARQTPLPRPAVQPVAPPPAAQTPPTAQTPPLAVTRVVTGRQALPARHLRRHPRTATPAPSSGTPRPVIQPPAPEVAAQRAGEELLAQHLDAVKQSMLLVASHGAISCSVLPVIAADERDVHAADMLTASLVCGIGVQPRQFAVNRLAPLATAALNGESVRPDAPEVSRLARTVTDDYLIIGSLKKAETGYLVSFYVLSRKDDAIVFDGRHPVLLPFALFPTPGDHPTVAQRFFGDIS